MTKEELVTRTTRFREKLLHKIPDNCEVHVMDDVSQVGGGALPAQYLPTTVIALQSKTVPVHELEKRLRDHKPPVIARIHKDQLRIDLRTVNEEDEVELEGALCKVLQTSN